MNIYEIPIHVIEIILQFIDNHVTIKYLSQYSKINDIIRTTSNNILKKHLSSMELLPYAWDGHEPTDIKLAVLIYVKNNEYLINGYHIIEFQLKTYKKFYKDYKKIKIINNDDYIHIDELIETFIREFVTIYRFWHTYINHTENHKLLIFSQEEINRFDNYMKYFISNYPILSEFICEVTYNWANRGYYLNDINFEYFRAKIISSNQLLMKISNILPKIKYIKNWKFE
jgi:hypothetical protein